MARIFVHLPLNISRTIEEMLKEYGREMEKKQGIHIDIVCQNQCQQDDGYPNNSEEENIPDMVISGASYFTKYSESYLNKNFRSMAGRFPLRQELADRGFTDPKGYFNPFTVMPFAVFYNPSLFEEKDLPSVWEDLLDNEWRGKIALPDRHHMAPKMLFALMKVYYPEKSDNLQKNFVCEGAPLNVVNAVDEGEYPIGITNISFARISRNKNIRMLWLNDGFFCMPLTMTWSKKADERLLEIGDFLLSRQVQEYLALQTFVPAAAGTAIPELLTDHDFSLRWEGWEHFLKSLKSSEG